MSADYVHGYSATEGGRLADQASTLTELLHGDVRYLPARYGSATNPPARRRPN